MQNNFSINNPFLIRKNHYYTLISLKKSTYSQKSFNKVLNQATYNKEVRFMMNPAGPRLPRSNVSKNSEPITEATSKLTPPQTVPPLEDLVTSFKEPSSSTYNAAVEDNKQPLQAKPVGNSLEFPKTLLEKTENIPPGTFRGPYLKTKDTSLEVEEKAAFTQAIEKGIVDFGNAGKYGQNGLARLSAHGNDLSRYSSSHGSSPSALKNTEEKQESVESSDLISSQYSAVILHVNEDTIILTPPQIHAVFVKGDPCVDDTVKGFAFATSQERVSKGTELTESTKNLKLSDQQPFSDKDQAQYAVPLNPPLVIESSLCTKIDSPKVESYLKEPEVQFSLDVLSSNVDDLKAKKYDGTGITTEKLQEFLELQKVLEETQKINEKKPETDDENETTI